MGAVNSGQSNDELVDNLMKSGYIRTEGVENVFRAVDRADYFLPSHKENAYKDLAWRHGNIHLSAPHTYSKVMEYLSLQPGSSFLNLGSGTGYLSTMAGLMLNQHGTNHGIELHEDCIKYAYERLEEFKQKSLALDEFDFCEPLFIQGNCLNIAPGRQYDRVYCGAACPENFEGFIKQFVRVGGILVMPFKDQLHCVKRINEHTWEYFAMLPMTFAMLVVPSPTEQILFHLPECDPLSLRELCRGRIRRQLRQRIWSERADLKTMTKFLLRHRGNDFSPSVEVKFVPLHQTSGRFINTFDGSDEAGLDRMEKSDDVQFDEVEEPDETQFDEAEEFHRRMNLVLGVTGFAKLKFILNMVEAGDAEGNSVVMEDKSVDVPVNNANEASLNIIDSDSETDQEEMDSVIAEDASSSNRDGNAGSNATRSDSETSNAAEPMAVGSSDIVLSSSYNSRSNSDDKIITAHYVNRGAFSAHMKEKIHQLPLPFSLKLYINYNREL